MSDRLEERRTSRRRQILEAACRCFARGGFRETAMLDICREANLSIGTIYRYFPDKEALILAVAEYVCGKDTLTLEKAAGTLGGSGGACENAKTLEGLLRKQEPRWLGRLRIELWSEALHNPPVRALVTRCMRDTLDQIYTQTGPVPSPEDPRYALALLQGLALQREILRSGRSVRETGASDI
ncbi:MAG: TetR/AcrR family transcriptional regulator [Rubrobacteraceae bacterium]|uniref:TetR/AcrR family transcriptional regulator n=1 Tax=Rubrobacter naiadicus TaxID=1392641 RepID=UPI00235DD731|nr:TetR/AcrR family transcriptional regulator [Rubrobacter naiadicus]MBX6763742.1 TetR/AcrR family transcriptional regulator [Rubrobacteraceae bacterium]MCL6437075.1 TetR/AcrR family transcriptional regulator [Rubrobacteraceae bacterium]